MRKALLYVIFTLSACLGMSAQALSDSITASLLTCSPGTEVYSLYGHTALRIRNHTQHADVVFNYGVFDFKRPNFTWHFILGECDYRVEAYNFDRFLSDYAQRGSWVIEQVLNLTQEEANRLYALLMINCQPENKVYRYNFLTNNCTTKARDMIEDAVMGHVAYGEAKEHFTYRQLLHRYTENYPWAEQGNDILLGADCDTLLTDRAAQFLPEQLMRYMAQAQIYDMQNNRRPLVASTAQLVAARKQAVPEAFPLSPLLTGLLTLAFFLLVMGLEYGVRRMMWLLDIVVMNVQGWTGALLCFMFLFSEHPSMDSNWQIWVLNPLPLIFLSTVVKRAYQHRTCFYHYLNALWLILFLVAMPWIPQDFSTMTVPVTLALLTRPLSYIFNAGRINKPTKAEKAEDNQEPKPQRT